jgi:hypothetical protein
MLGIVRSSFRKMSALCLRKSPINVRSFFNINALPDADARSCASKLIKISQKIMLDDPRRVGDQYTFVALDPETSVVPSYRVGKRDLPTATTFIADLSEWLANRVQLSSDALSAYVEAVERAFGADVDYGQEVKVYEAEPVGRGRYSPPHVVGARAP